MVQPDVEGWLQKRGPQANYSFERRYCILTNSVLSFFADEERIKKKGDIRLKGETLITAFDSENCPGDGVKYAKERRWGFVIDIDGPCGGKDRSLHYFDAGNEDDHQNWLVALGTAIDVLIALSVFVVGMTYVTLGELTMREGESLDSEVLAGMVPAGGVLKILELGGAMPRRAKVVWEAGDKVGWISMATPQGVRLLDNTQKSEKTLSKPSSALAVKKLLESARAGNLDAMVQVLSSPTPPKLSCHDVQGKTPLIYACAFGHKRVAEYLLGKSEVDCNALDDRLRTALHHAAKKPRTSDEEAKRVQTEIATLLIRRKADFEMRDNLGCTALVYSVANNDAYMTQMLLDAGANVNVTDFEAHSALDYAKDFGHEELVELLVSNGAEQQLSDEDDSVDSHERRDSAVGGRHSTRPRKEESGSSIATTAETKAKVKKDKHSKKESVVEDEEAPKKKTSKVKDRKKKSATENAALKESVGVQSSSTPTRSKDRKNKSTSENARITELVAITSSSQPTSFEAESEKSFTSSHAEPKKGADSSEPESKKSSIYSTTKGDKLSADKTVAKVKQKADEKKLKGEPRKGEKKRRSVALAMDELKEAMAEESTKVAAKVELVVESPEAAEGDQRLKAKQKLDAILAGSPALIELQTAIENAVAASVEAHFIEPANQKMAELKQRSAAREELANAMETSPINVEALDAAIKGAEAAKIGKKELEKAKKMLEVEIPKDKARKALKEAAIDGNVNTLKKAVEAAEKLKLSAHDLEPYREMLIASESKAKVEELLAAAIQSKDVQGLKFAISQAKGVGIEVTAAEKLLKEEEPKADARAYIASVLAAPTEQGLEDAIQRAKDAKLLASEVEYIEKMLMREKAKAGLLRAVTDSIAKCELVDMKDMDALVEAKAGLSEVILAAKEGGVAEALLADSELRRRRIHNAIEDLKGAIRVFCRVRPLSQKEKAQGDIQCTSSPDPITISVTTNDGKKEDVHSFSFDAVFTPGTQEEVFNDCRDLVQSAVDGYNVTMFAYGQSGAGKTFTMYGVPGLEGTSPRTIQELFRVVDANSSRYTFTVMGSMLELHKCDLVDLLTKGTKLAEGQGKLKVRSDPTGGVAIEHLRQEQCQSYEELMDLLERGNKGRSVSATNLNSESSRSHLILMIKIVSINIETKKRTDGKMLIVDLAGSERLKKSQTTADAQKESIEINKSLTALGDVIEALTKGHKQIPYRNHKLTELMQDSLGGTAKTLMFVNCSPASSNQDETVTSLKWAQRAKQVKNDKGDKVKSKQ